MVKKPRYAGLFNPVKFTHARRFSKQFQLVIFIYVTYNPHSPFGIAPALSAFMSSHANLVEVFLILDRAKQCLPHWVTALARLSAPDIPPYVTVQAHYEAAVDRAYLRLAYDLRQLGRDRLRFVSQVAELAEIKLIEPAAWPVAERTRFMNDRIAGCQVAVIDRRTISDTLTELARRARAVRALATPTAAPLPPVPTPPQSKCPQATASCKFRS